MSQTKIKSPRIQMNFFDLKTDWNPLFGSQRDSLKINFFFRLYYIICTDYCLRNSLRVKAHIKLTLNIIIVKCSLYIQYVKYNYFIMYIKKKKDIKNYELYVLVKLKNRTTVFSGIQGYKFFKNIKIWLYTRQGRY